MNFLNYKNDVLHFENVSLEEIAEVSGTPTYVYSEGGFIHAVGLLKRSF